MGLRYRSTNLIMTCKSTSDKVKSCSRGRSMTLGLGRLTPSCSIKRTIVSYIFRTPGFVAEFSLKASRQMSRRRAASDWIPR